MSSPLSALSLSKKQIALEYLKKDLITSLDIERPNWALTPEDTQKSLTYLSHQRAAALGDFAYVSTIDWVIKSIYLPMLSQQPGAASLYAAYNINSEQNFSMLESLIEAVDYIKSVSLITVGITENNARPGAETMTYDGFKHMLKYVEAVFENNKHLSIGDSFENLATRHYPVNWLEKTVVPVADAIVTSYDVGDTTKAFEIIGDAANLNVPTKIKYAFRTPIEAAFAVSELRKYVPFALTRIVNLSARLDIMPDYRDKSTIALYQLMQANGHIPGIGEAELL